MCHFLPFFSLLWRTKLSKSNGPIKLSCIINNHGPMVSLIRLLDGSISIAEYPNRLPDDLIRPSDGFIRFSLLRGPYQVVLPCRALVRLLTIISLSNSQIIRSSLIYYIVPTLAGPKMALWRPQTALPCSQTSQIRISNYGSMKLAYYNATKFSLMGLSKLPSRLSDGPIRH